MASQFPEGNHNSPIRLSYKEKHRLIQLRGYKRFAKLNINKCGVRANINNVIFDLNLPIYREELSPADRQHLRDAFPVDYDYNYPIIDEAPIIETLN